LFQGVRMTALRVIVAVCALCAVVRGQDSRNILKYLSDEGFSTLVELIQGAGIASEFEDLDAIKTVFAPTDAAFKMVPQETMAALQTNVTLLKEILQGHVVMDETVLGLFIRDGLTKTSAAGTTLEFNKYNTVKTVNGAVIGADTILANGVVHTIDKVLMPITHSVGTLVAEADPEFRDLFGFLVLARLFGTLTKPGPYTVFAPTDAAFEGVDVTNLIANRTALAEVLTDHVVGKTLWSAGLTDGMTLTTLSGKTLTVHLANGTMVENANVIKADMGATNGVIHVIDTVLTP